MWCSGHWLQSIRLQSSGVCMLSIFISSILRRAGQYQQNPASSSLSASCLSVYHSEVRYSASNIRSQIFRCLSLLSGMTKAAFTGSFWPGFNFFSMVSPSCGGWDKPAPRRKSPNACSC